MDEDIAGHVSGLTEGEIAAGLAYTNTRGEAFTQPHAQVLAHFFNHQTHHRGQCHAMLTRLTGTAPELDLIYCLRET